MSDEVIEAECVVCGRSYDIDKPMMNHECSKAENASDVLLMVIANLIYRQNEILAEIGESASSIAYSMDTIGEKASSIAYSLDKQ